MFWKKRQANDQSDILSASSIVRSPQHRQPEDGSRHIHPTAEYPDGPDCDQNFTQYDLDVALSAFMACASPETLDIFFTGWFSKRYHEMWIEGGHNLDSLFETYNVTVVQLTQSCWEFMRGDSYLTEDSTDFEAIRDMALRYKALAARDRAFHSFLEKEKRLSYQGSSIKDQLNWKMFPFPEFIPQVKVALQTLRNADLNELGVLVQTHGRRLKYEVGRLVKLNTDRYGILNAEPVVNEICYLIRASRTDVKLRTMTINDAAYQVWAICDELDPSSTVSDPKLSSGPDFEIWCLQKLQDLGFDAHLTPPGPDQGIDIIALIDARRVGIQCKLYKGSVGNDAVQEAISGKAFYMLDDAVVISTGKYTRSAKDLARMSSIALLAETEIYKISEHVAFLRSE